ATLIWVALFFLINSSIKQYWYDRIGDFLITPVYLILDLLFVTIFLTLLNKKVKINGRLLATVPFFFIFGPIFSLGFYYQLAEKYYKIKQPAFMQLINDWSSLMILVGILWMILFF